MRNAIFIGICMFFAVVAGAACISWYSQAVAGQNVIEKAAKDKHIPYEHAKISGFPGHVFVSLVSSGGSVTFGVNAWSNHFSIRIEGEPACRLESPHAAGIFGNLWDFTYAQDAHILDCPMAGEARMAELLALLIRH